MPEGHSLHRIARQFSRNFVGHRVSASSPQGRFAEGAALLDGRTMVDARASGKQLFLEFEGGRWLRVHLGLYGAWDFAGEITTDATIRSSNGRIGQTNQHGTIDDDLALSDADGEDSVASIGAPRLARRHKARLRISEQEKEDDDADFSFPPDPVGQVRARLLTEDAVADLRGPTACEVLDPAGVEAVLDRLGPDPVNDRSDAARERFVAAVLAKGSPVALLLMDQSVVGGIGNVYRAEMLFRARLNPHTPGKLVPREVVESLWDDWAYLLDVGVRTGQMLTMDGLDPVSARNAMANREDRHWVYRREGLPCRVCGTNIVMEPLASRKLYWCPFCQL